MGRSRISIYRHRLLCTKVLIGSGLSAIISRERYADDPSGLCIVREASHAAIISAMAALDGEALDFAALIIDRGRCTITYRSSPVASIPLYLTVRENAVWLDWDYYRLLVGQPLLINTDIACAQIAGFSTYGTDMVVPGLHRGTAGASLSITKRGIEVSLPSPVRHEMPGGVTSEADLETLLFNATRAILEARPLERGSTAIELSGGMDSALTSIAAADTMGAGLLSIGAQFSGTMGEAQQERRSLIRQRCQSDDLSVPGERFAPFGPESLRRTRYGVLPEDENYPELFEALFGMLRSAGIDTLITGLGGDELYVAFEGEEGAPHRQESSVSPFLTAAGSRAATRGRGRYPAGWLQETCWSGAASQAQRVLRYGLWPVHPYQNVELARLIARLPRAYRRDRALLRRTLTRVLENDIFEGSYVKETFKPVALRGIRENREYLLDLVRRSELARSDELDRAALVTALSRDVEDMDHETYNALFRALKVICFFQ